MSPEEAVVARLGDIAAVNALVGTRIYQLKLPQKPTLPAIRVQEISEVRSYHLRGGSSRGRTRVQVDVYANETAGNDPYGDAIALAAAVHGDEAGSGLSGWVGDVDGSPASMRVTGILRDSRTVEYEAEELRLVRVRQDYLVHFQDLS